MSSIATAIITCDRTKFTPPRQNYFRTMCKSMERSGFRDQLGERDRFAIFDAGPHDPAWMDWMPHRKTELWCGPDKTRLPLIQNTHRAMTWLVWTGCDYGILLSDDFICCKNWFAEVRRWLDDPGTPHPAACYALCPRYPWSRLRVNLERRWAHYPLHDFYCAVCAYPMAALRDYLLSEQRVRVDAWKNKSDFIPRDYARSGACRSTRTAPTCSSTSASRAALGTRTRRVRTTSCSPARTSTLWTGTTGACPTRLR